jgi:hypothetical protein
LIQCCSSTHSKTFFRKLLEDPRRFGLDLFSNQGVQALARREIDLDAEAFLKQRLAATRSRTLNRPRGVYVDKEIQIAFGVSPVAGRRAEQMERRGAERLDGVSLTAQFLEGLGSGHGYNNNTARPRCGKIADEPYAALAGGSASTE